MPGDHRRGVGGDPPVVRRRAAEAVGAGKAKPFTGDAAVV